MFKQRKWLAILVIVLLLLIWRGVFFAVSVHRINLSGDEAIRALQAISIAQPKDSFHVQIQQEPRGLFGHYPLLFMAQPYLFPIESYIMAPFMRWLPRSPLGARLIPMFMGLITCGLGLLFVNRAFRDVLYCGGEDTIRKFCHSGALFLIVFPTTYLLVLQVAYPLPSYQALMMFGLLALWLAEQNRTASGRNPFFALGAGFSAAIAASNSLLALPLVGGVAVIISVGRDWRKSLTGMASCLLGIGCGLTPYFLAKELYPGAHTAVSTLVNWSVALKRLFDPTIIFTLPVMLGMKNDLLPGWKTLVGIIPQRLLPYFGYLWLVFIFCALFICAYFFICKWKRNRWPEVTVWDVMIVLSVVSLLLFVFSTRFGRYEFRYLVLVGLFYPFILAWIMSISKGIWRYLLAGVAWGLVLVNIGTSLLLMRAWLDKSFDGGFTDTRPVVKWLNQKGIEYCYASYMDVYTINYFADERIVCSQPYNERFYGWPYPYGKVVDKAINVPFVLSPGQRFSQTRFESDLRKLEVNYQKTSIGACEIYNDFSVSELQSGHPLDPTTIKVTVSTHPVDADTLSDGVLTHKWRSHAGQSKGMWIELKFPDMILVKRLKFFYNDCIHDHALSLDIAARLPDGTWKIVKSGVEWAEKPFDFVNNHPVYINRIQSVEMEGVQTDTVRIEIAKPNLGRDWAIGEIEVQTL
jgi:hypothetical protein